MDFQRQVGPVTTQNDEAQQHCIEELKRQNSLLRTQLSETTDKFSQQM